MPKVTIKSPRQSVASAMAHAINVGSASSGGGFRRARPGSLKLDLFGGAVGGGLDKFSSLFSTTMGRAESNPDVFAPRSARGKRIRPREGIIDIRHPARKSMEEGGIEK